MIQAVTLLGWWKRDPFQWLSDLQWSGMKRSRWITWYIELVFLRDFIVLRDIWNRRECKMRIMKTLELTPPKTKAWLAMENHHSFIGDTSWNGSGMVWVGVSKDFFSVHPENWGNMGKWLKWSNLTSAYFSDGLAETTNGVVFFHCYLGFQGGVCLSTGRLEPTPRPHPSWVTGGHRNGMPWRLIPRGHRWERRGRLNPTCSKVLHPWNLTNWYRKWHHIWCRRYICFNPSFWVSVLDFWRWYIWGKESQVDD